VALVNEALGRPVGFLNAALYRNAHCFNDVVAGDNDITGSLPGYRAGPGWDACTGLGSPKGAELVRSL